LLGSISSSSATNFAKRGSLRSGPQKGSKQRFFRLDPPGRSRILRRWRYSIGSIKPAQAPKRESPTKEELLKRHLASS
jgi:hypothetical protein